MGNILSSFGTQDGSSAVGSNAESSQRPPSASSKPTSSPSTETQAEKQSQSQTSPEKPSPTMPRTHTPTQPRSEEQPERSSERTNAKGEEAVSRPTEVPKNEDDCDETACKIGKKTKKEFFAAFQHNFGSKGKTAPKEGGPAVQSEKKETEDSDEGSSSSPASTSGILDDCPLDRDSLGYCSWAFLHSVAAFYPNEPTDEEKETMRNLMKGVATFYPCKVCRDDFKEEIQSQPPKVESRRDLSLWVCEQHNKVNEKLGKPTFRCDFEELMNRWRKSRKCEELE